MITKENGNNILLKKYIKFNKLFLFLFKKLADFAYNERC